MVFRRDSKVDAFQRQISALRHQLGGESGNYEPVERDRAPALLDDSHHRQGLPDLDLIRSESTYPTPVSYDEPALPQDLPDPAHPVPAIDAHTSVIAHTTAWNGNLDSSGSLHIHGRVEGSLTARNTIFIAEEAEIDATVHAASVIVAGAVRGSIQCADRFELLPRGRVVGDVRAPVIVIHEGAALAGGISMSPVKEPRLASAASASARAARGGD